MNLAEELTSILGADKVSRSEEAITEHSIDKWLVAHPPDAVVFAESTDDVSKTLAFANERGVPVTARGAGVGYVGGAVPIKGGIALSVARMTRIKELNTSDGVAVVEPGVITVDLQNAAREKGWFYPPDPASLKECSLGGNIATNAGGPRCLKYGVTRPYVLGLEVVLADGRVLQTGGRCHKNKTGFDLVSLFVGSEGMLGIVTEATLRLIPHPPMRAMISASFPDFDEAARAVETVLGSGFLPAALEITDKFTLQAAREYKGRGVVPDGDAHILVEIDGHADSVRSELLLLENHLRSNHNIVFLETADTEDACENLWELRRAFSYSLRATGLTKLNEDVVVPRGKLCDLVSFCEELQAEFGFPVASFGHAGDGNIHVNIMVDKIDEPDVRERSERALDRLFKKVLALGGVITGEHGIGIAKKRWFGDAVSSESRSIHAALKNALDPKGILNPGKFV